MFRRGLLMSISWAAMSVLAAGCGESGGGNITLAEAGGTVNFKGAPLAGASVTFVPDNGPVATATTDLSGKFKLMTAGQSGAAIGPRKATVTAWEGGAAPTSTSAPMTKEEHERQMTEMREKAMKGGGATTGPKSIIPERYAKPETIQLSFTVDKDPSMNQCTIALTE